MHDQLLGTLRVAGKRRDKRALSVDTDKITQSNQ